MSASPTSSARKNFRRIRFLRNIVNESSRGEMNADGGQTEICKAWAQVNYGTGRERRQVGIDIATQPVTLRVRTNATTRSVTTSDIAELDGASWNITSVAPWGRREIDFTAIRRS